MFSSIQNYRMNPFNCVTSIISPKFHYWWIHQSIQFKDLSLILPVNISWIFSLMYVIHFSSIHISIMQMNSLQDEPNMIFKNNNFWLFIDFIENNETNLAVNEEYMMDYCMVSCVMHIFRKKKSFCFIYI